LCSSTQISYKMKEFSAIRPQVRAKLHIFFIAHAQNGYISTSGQKSDITIVLPDPDFLYTIQEFGLFGHK